MLDLSYLIDHVMHSVQPLDWEGVVASPVPLKVVASSLDALAPVILDGFSCRADLAACLKASANVPEIAGGPLLHRGQRLVDAAVFEPVPFRSAIADGCTHVLVLCTRPRRPRASGVRRLNAALADAVESAVKRAVLSPDYMVPAWKAEVATLMQDGLSQDEMLLLATDEGAAALPWFAGAHVFPVYPGAAARCEEGGGPACLPHFRLPEALLNCQPVAALGRASRKICAGWLTRACPQSPLQLLPALHRRPDAARRRGRGPARRAGGGTLRAPRPPRLFALRGGAVRGRRGRRLQHHHPRARGEAAPAPPPVPHPPGRLLAPRLRHASPRHPTGGNRPRLCT